VSAAARGAPDRRFATAGALLFLASAVATIRLCSDMSGGMPMPGGWIMSMAWMPMGATAWSSAAAFLAMWLVMMAAMMLPSLLPALAAYRRSLGAAGRIRRVSLTALAGAGYFLTWGIVGVLAYPVGAGISTAAMRSAAVARAVPLFGAAALLLAGALQLSPWKRRLLSSCRAEAVCEAPGGAGPRNGWAHGVRIGARCVLCCAGYTLALLVVGVMDLRAMALTGAGITLERVGPMPALVARVAGGLIVAAGILSLYQALARG
jgi:predicted metal-binding membrane protein